jgi:hypothetical protein
MKFTVRQLTLQHEAIPVACHMHDKAAYGIYPGIRLVSNGIQRGNYHHIRALDTKVINIWPRLFKCKQSKFSGVYIKEVRLLQLLQYIELFNI